MRLLVVDHGCADPPTGRVHLCRRILAAEGIDALGCGPAAVSSLEGPSPGLTGIPLRAVAAANRAFAAAVREGSAGAFLSTTTRIPASLLGLVRETARQAIAEAVDGFDPEAILVLHAGILADLAVETGLPVAVHVSPGDLAAARGAGRVEELVASALSSAEVVVPVDAETASSLADGWLDGPARDADLAGPIDESCGARIADAVRRACRRRSGR